MIKSFDADDMKMYDKTKIQVHNMNTKLTSVQAFARKLIRPSGYATQEDIDNEVRVIKKLLDNGGHRNIVTIFYHGWFKGDQYYIFDMELCALNLDDFIREELKLKIGLTQYFHPEYVNSEMGCFTLFNIIHDILYGLQFIQSKGEMHRDLKPHNGGSCTSQLTVCSASLPLRQLLEVS